jgi:hypothetical protein
MAHSSILVVVACLVFTSGIASAALTTSEIVQGINSLTAKSEALQSTASKINLLSPVQLIINQGSVREAATQLQDIGVTAGGIADVILSGTTLRLS